MKVSNMCCMFATNVAPTFQRTEANFFGSHQYGLCTTNMR